MKHLMTICVVTLLVVCATANASLGTVNMTGYDFTYSDQATIPDLSTNPVYTGVYQWTISSPTGLGVYVPGWGFCTELVIGASTGSHDVITLEDTPNYTAAKADLVRELWGRFFDPTWATGANKQYAEAFNACIWEIVYETDAWDVTSGAGFFATGIEQSATANDWLASLDGTGPLATNLYVLHDGQDFLVQVPEPATLLILGLGGLLCGKIKMKKSVIS